MLPMNCPRCSGSAIRVLLTNNQLEHQIVRRRRCVDCGHKWFTVEVGVPDYAVGWSALHHHKPVLRADMEITAVRTKLGRTLKTE